jgi:hypothetical protein
LPTTDAEKPCPFLIKLLLLTINYVRMNLSITHKQRWLVLTIVAIGITGAAFGILSTGDGIWISLIAPLSLIAFALLFKNPANPQQNTASSQPTTTINKLEEMGNLIELRDQGKISDAEYQERRANLVYYN